METGNRTWLCCVVFLDVVAFTKHHLQEQMAIKVHLDRQIQRLLEKHGDDDYILLDRGDGAAVCFLLEPEAALYFALNLRDAVRAHEDSTVPYEIRTGINLGPVRIVLDVNGEKTTLGEGINCAARVMDFAGAGQIYVSRSFYEVIGCLSQEYSELFEYLGKKADKHVREFELYEVAPARGRIDTDITAPATTGELPDNHDWDVEALRQREHDLSLEIGPMARILVQRAALKASSLEELDSILAQSSLQVAPECRETVVTQSLIDDDYLQKADELLREYLGPIAPLLVRRAAGNAPDHASLGRMLADELDTEQEQQAFLSRLDDEH